MSMIRSKGTLVNKEITSEETRHSHRAKFATALTSDGQLRRELAISEIPDNDVSN